MSESRHMDSLKAPVVSIAICTRDRCESLKLTLESLNQLDVPTELSTELVVIDNGSSDHTSDLLSGTSFTRIGYRWVVENERGLACARNRALLETRGNVILFSDDDVRFPTNWIAEMSRPILTGEADAVAGGVIFAGDIEPILPSYRHWFAGTQGMDPAAPGRLVGANMAISRQVLSCVSDFDRTLGAGALGFGEETLFALRMLSKGYRIVSAFDTAVVHHMDPRRLSRRHIIDMAIRMGNSNGYISYHARQGYARLLRPRIAWTQANLWLRRLVRYPGYLNLKCPPVWEVNRLEHIGFLKQIRKERRRVRLYRDSVCRPTLTLDQPLDPHQSVLFIQS